METFTLQHFLHAQLGFFKKKKKKGSHGAMLTLMSDAWLMIP